MDLINLSLEVIQGLQYLACAVTALMLAVEADCWPFGTVTTFRVILYTAWAFTASPIIV